MSVSISGKHIEYFEALLLDFYRKAGREFLPWRITPITAYEVWVSEIMLQQTQVSRVIEYYTRFLKKYPNAQSLAVTTWEEFLPYYAGLGYYRRGRNMIAAAQKVVTDFGGEFPHDKKLLQTLPGVGDYTASATLSFAYDENHLAWDTNLIRVVGRFFYGSKQYDFDRGFFEDFLKANRKQLNAAFMDFGSAICTGRPKCNTCPLATKCVYYKEDGAQEKKSLQNVVQDTGIDWRKAQVFLWLHKDHALYYSLQPDQFAVFKLDAAHQSRAHIKLFFKERYDLDLAVRPPHKKILVHGKPTLFVNAQILLGKPTFATFSKAEVLKYNQALTDIL